MKAITHQDCSLYYLGKLSEYLHTGDLLVHLKELETHPEPFRELEEAVSEVEFFQRKKWDSIFDLGLYRLVNYILVRALKPEIFLETGVLHGITSNFILTALRRNHKGLLISIDYPSYFESGPSNQDGYDDTLPPGKEPGWVIPERNLPYWKLTLGKSLVEIPKVVEDNNSLDIFLHDSEHTYSTMWGEFNLAWPKLKKDGILICDNIDSNTSFFDFCKQVKRSPILFPEATDNQVSNNTFRFGLIRK